MYVYNMGNMGNKQKDSNTSQSENAENKRNVKPVTVPQRKVELLEPDYDFLISQTGMPRNEITYIFEKFKEKNSDGKLNTDDFVSLYTSLRYEDFDKLKDISRQVFRVFDTDLNGSISFNEFMIGFVFTSQGDMRQRLNYAFVLYDVDRNGYLDMNEVTIVIESILILLGVDSKGFDVHEVAAECMKGLDKNEDGWISRDEFINGLLRNYKFRTLMNPFN